MLLLVVGVYHSPLPEAQTFVDVVKVRNSKEKRASKHGIRKWDPIAQEKRKEATSEDYFFREWGNGDISNKTPRVS